VVVGRIIGNFNLSIVQRAEMRIVKLQDRVPSKELRGRLGLDDIISVLQQNRLQWYGHVLRKEEMYGV